MEYVNIGIGLILIVCGFLVKRYPNLIAGYNTMSPERKKKVNIDGLSNWMRNGFIVLGLIILVSNYLLRQFGLDNWANNIMVVTIIAGTLIIAIFAQRFDKG